MVFKGNLKKLKIGEAYILFSVDCWQRVVIGLQLAHLDCRAPWGRPTGGGPVDTPPPRDDRG